MLFISDLVLWLLISVHLVGGATLFRRFFPNESPWLGYLVPVFAFVMVLNFIEHLVGLPSLLGLLPLTLGVAIWSIARPGYSWTGLRLPTSAFLLIFAFNFILKSFHPDVDTDDAMADMNRVLNYSFGERLPPTDGWLPPFEYRWYYSYQHYAAAIMKRLFSLEIGTAYNVSFTLLNSLICFTGAAIAYLASGRRAWASLLTIPILEAGFTGSMPYLILTMQEPDFDYGVDLDAGWRNHDPGAIFQLLKHDPHQALVLEGPGDWIWHYQYHANLSGFLLFFLAAFSALKILDAPRCNWPWICLLLITPLSMLAAAWYLPLCGIMCFGSLLVALALRRRPENWPRVLIITLAGLILLWPALVSFAAWPHEQLLGWTEGVWHTPFWVFVIQWWPIYIPWLLLCFLWPRLNAGLRLVHVSVAVFFILIELFTVGDWRWDTVEKMWGAVYGLGLVALLPVLMVSRNFVCRAVMLVIVICTVLTLTVRLDYARYWIDWNKGFLHLEGDSYMLRDEQKSRMLEVLQQLHKSVILAGKCGWNYTPPPGLAVFSENRCYVAWYTTEQIIGHRGEVDYRTALNNQFYADQMADPLGFLRANKIDAVLIAPDDNLDDSLVADLRAKLSPAYEYVDCKGEQPRNAGVFLLRPLPASARD